MVKCLMPLHRLVILLLDTQTSAAAAVLAAILSSWRVRLAELRHNLCHHIEQADIAGCSRWRFRLVELRHNLRQHVEQADTAGCSRVRHATLGYEMDLDSLNSAAVMR